MEDWRAVRGIAAHNLLCGLVGSDDLVKVNDWNMEGCKVSLQPGMNAAVAVGERDDVAAEYAARWNHQLVVCVNRVEQAAL